MLKIRQIVPPAWALKGINSSKKGKSVGARQVRQTADWQKLWAQCKSQSLTPYYDSQLEAVSLRPWGWTAGAKSWESKAREGTGGGHQTDEDHHTCRAVILELLAPMSQMKGK